MCPVILRDTRITAELFQHKMAEYAEEFASDFSGDVPGQGPPSSETQCSPPSDWSEEKRAAVAALAEARSKERPVELIAEDDAAARQAPPTPKVEHLNLPRMPRPPNAMFTIPVSHLSHFIRLT